MTFPNAPEAGRFSEEIQIERRKLLSGLSLAGLGWLAYSGLAKADLTGAGSTGTSAIPNTPHVPVPPPMPQVTVQTGAAPSKPAAAPTPASIGLQRLDLTDLPSDWARNQGTLLKGYVAYLWRLKLKRLSPAQVIEAHAKCKGSVWNCLPPMQMWPRMALTLRIVDRIAKEMNIANVEVVSANRCPAYNANCEGAAPGSWHQANVALDVVFPVPAHQVTATARDLRDRGLFKGGVGGYWNFTHIDSRGENVNW